MRVLLALLLVGVGALLGGPVYDRLFPGPKRFESVRMEFMLGGPKGDPFVALIERGARDAQAVYGPEIHFLWSDWDVEWMTQQFKDAIKRQPDVIVAPGHPGEDRLGEPIRQAENVGILVTTYNVPLPMIQRSFEESGFGYVGQDQRAAGQALARATMQESGAPPSTKVVLLGVGPMGERSERTRGIQSTFLQAGHPVQLVEVTRAMRADVEGLFRPALAEAIAAAPGSIIVVDDSAGAKIAHELEAIGVAPDDHFVAVYDFYRDSPAALRSGYVDLVADQQAYLQGYLSVLQASLSSKYQFRGLSIDTGAHFVTRKDVDRVERVQLEGIR